MKIFVFLIIALSLFSADAQVAPELPSKCELSLTGDQGTISSANTLASSENCTWTINLPPTKFIHFSVSHLTLYNALNSCSNSLSINETVNSTTKSLGLFCNSSIPSPILTTTSSARIRFQTNNTAESKTAGTSNSFQLMWKALDNPNAISTCSKKLTDPSGVIASPNYLYGNSLPFTCTYKIIQPLGKMIQFSLTDLHITMDNETCYNRLNIYDGEDEDSTLMASICDAKYYIPSRIFNSSANYLTIKIIFERPLEIHHGFHAVYRTLNTQCGGLLEEKGIIESPGFGTTYPPNLKCKWTIHVGAGKALTIGFVSFDIAWHETCADDYVQFTEISSNGTRAILGKYCGNDLPTSFLSKSSVTEVEFRSKEKTDHKGFQIRYFAIDQIGQ
uniref:CUBN_2 protein n=1 Tax=Fopius arisanus TaxID=64838 RepID=A0A0C9QTI4_9HYME